MPITLTITDNGEGSGLTAMLSGNLGLVPFSLQASTSLNQTWNTVGVFTGATPNESIDLIPPLFDQLHLYRAVYESGSTVEISNVVMIAAAGPVSSLHMRTANAIAQAIYNLQLPLIEDRVFVQLFPNETNIKLPCILITVVETEKIEAKDSGTNKITFPTVVEILDRNAIEDIRPMPKYLAIREAIMLLFRRQIEESENNWMALPGVPEINRLLVQPKTIIDPELPKYQFLQSGLIIWSECWHQITNWDSWAN